MTDILSKIDAVYSLEQLSAGKTFVHKLHPMCKIAAAFVFIVCVMSFGKYDFGRLVPFIFYPAVLMPLSETPYLLLLKRVLIALPFCLFIGVSDVFLLQNTAFTLFNIAVSFGVLSFITILFRAYLCVMAVLMLVAVTPFTQITAQLHRLKIPNIFVIMFEMTYRYIGVLIGEAASVNMAYSLRSNGGRGVDLRHAGSFIGGLLLRSFARAERIYSAMVCRGYALRNVSGAVTPPRAGDVVYCVCVCGFCVMVRLVDFGAVVGV